MKLTSFFSDTNKGSKLEAYVPDHTVLQYNYQIWIDEGVMQI